MKKGKRFYLKNLLFPAVIFGSITGIFTALAVTFYKMCAKYVIRYSEMGYHYIREHLYIAPIVLAAFFGIACLFSLIYKKLPNLRGGGIPTSIGILRGIISFQWLKYLVGVFMMSLTAFLIGVPLGNEGPSVQMGTAIGRGSVYSLAKKQRAWDRYTMTGGACAGFSVATGAPISGIMFAIEEAHQRISPMIIIVSSVSVMFAYVTTEILDIFFNVGGTLFPRFEPIKLSVADIWIPLLIGLCIGLFAVLFLKYYKLIHTFFKNTLKKLSQTVKIFLMFTVTFLLGLCSYSFISTGHELIIELFEGGPAILMLVVILLVRSTLTLGANTSGITGGTFVPVLALGAVIAAILGKGIIGVFGYGGEYYTAILVLGITACISGMMKMPITAILFAVEALSCYENIIYVVVVSAVSFAITEIFGVQSINDSVLEARVEEVNEGKSVKVIDTFVTVQKNAFAIRKQVRDIFWPANLFVLSVQHTSKDAEVDVHGGKAIREGDVLHVRYSTYDEAQTRAELMAIVGEQDYHEKEADVI